VKLRLAVLVLVALALGGLCSGASASTFYRGFVDDVWFDAPADGISTATWIAKTRSTGARFVQIEVDWTSVEPNAPSGHESLTSPSAREFSFNYLDSQVSRFVGTGLTPVFLVTDAPRWAEGSDGTATEYATGGYEPNATAFGDLGRALAARYSGHFRPPNRRSALPRVRYLQAWAEANTPYHLTPQWTKSNGHLVNTGAILYRQMLNDFYAGVKAGDRGDSVLTTGLEGYGDAPGHGLMRTHPVTFLENVLCLHQNLREMDCPDPAHFDVLASDPYDIGAPTVHAVSQLDASAPDLGRLTRVVKAALAAHTLFPARHKPLWVTEFGYDSNPPNPTPGTISTETQARWLEESFYVFWHEGVSTVMWYLARDQTPPYDANYFSGVYFRDGSPKPSYTAYRFPFVVMHDGGRSQIWGISPVTGTVDVEVASGSSWRAVTSIHAGAGTPYTRVLSLPAGRYRATIGTQSSLVWDYTPAKKA
jgi:hypothetical protein